MKKIFSLTLVVAMAFAVMSCGGDETPAPQPQPKVYTPIEVKVKPSTTDVSGDLRGCFEVVDREYKIKGDEYSWSSKQISVKLKRTSKNLPSDFETYDLTAFSTYYTDRSYIQVGFGAEFYDADGDIVCKVDAKRPYSSEEPIVAIKLGEGEDASITFSIYEDDDVVAKIASFKVTSMYLLNKNDGTSNSDDSNDDNTDSDDSNDDNTDSDDKSDSYYYSSVKSAVDEATETVKGAYKKAYDDYEEAYKEALDDYEEAVENALEDAWGF